MSSPHTTPKDSPKALSLPAGATLGNDGRSERSGRFAIIRRSWRDMTWRRLFLGGRLTDAGRLPRYSAMFLLGAALIWAPIMGYLKTAPLKYSSHMTLILPGSGASASVNLNNIGQASSYANSAFSNGSISPTETYKRLLGADRILDGTATRLGLDRPALGRPRITLVDQTSLIHIEVTSTSPDAARQQGDALLAAFFEELDALRQDEMTVREDSGLGALDDYFGSVRDTRAAISTLQADSGLISADQFRDRVAANDRLSQDILARQAALAQQSGTLRALESALGIAASKAAITLKLYADAPYRALLEDLSVQSAARANARARFGARHPTVIAAESAYDGAQRAALIRAALVTGLSMAEATALDRAPDGARATLLADLVRESIRHDGIATELATMQARHTEEIQTLAALAPVAAELEDRQRNFDVAKAVFSSAIARTESTKTDVYASYPLVQVLENPSRPDAPSSPRRKLAFAAGVAATLMLLIGLLLGWIRLALINRLLARPKSDATP